MLVILVILGMIPSNAKALDILFLVRKFPYINQMYIINQVTGLIDRGHTVYVLSQLKNDEPICSALSNYEQKYRIFYDLSQHGLLKQQSAQDGFCQLRRCGFCL